MRIGIPKEIKTHEYRVSITPDAAAEIKKHGHHIYVERNAGSGVGFSDQEYQNAGAEICDSADDVFQHSEMIIKVKEPQPEECKKLKKNQTIFTYLHLAADPKQAEALCRSEAMAIAYETITNEKNKLPLLEPMSEVAGRMSIQVGAYHLQKDNHGKGLLLGGVPGVHPANVVIIGGGVAGTHAAQMAMGLKADVTIFDISDERLNALDALYGGRIKTIYSTYHAVQKAIMTADLVIGAVLIPGSAAPKLITKEMVKQMTPGTVLVDIAIDQGGCFETSRPTTHDQPTFIIDGVVHYCVANMPGAVARTSTFALVKSTLPYVLKLANSGIKESLIQDKHLANGLNVAEGKITHPIIAKDLNLDYHSPKWLSH